MLCEGNDNQQIPKVPLPQANSTPFPSNYDNNQYGNLGHLATETPENSLQNNEQIFLYGARGILL